MPFSIFILCFIVSNGFTSGCKYEVSQICSSECKIMSLEKEVCECNSRCAEETTATTLKDESSIFDVRFDAFPKKCKTDTLPRCCSEATACTNRSGIYRISLQRYDMEPFLVECDVKTEGGGWTLIQRRQDGSEDFFRDWSDYKRGFGSIQGEFFIGLDKLYALTNYDGPQELLILMGDKNEVRKASYSNFVVGPEHELYPLKHVGVFSGDAGDSLTNQLGAKFSTKDRDNDVSSHNCAELFTGAWWYKACHMSNLNGKYGDTTNGKGICWLSFRASNVSISHVTMMIRRRRF